MVCADRRGRLRRRFRFDRSVQMIEFREFPKIPRMFRECVITEKIDGTNAQVIVTEDGRVAAASRSRLITPESDNLSLIHI